MVSPRLAFPAAICCLIAHSSWSATPGQTIDNFALLDQRGKFHELYYLSDMKAVVLMTHDNECEKTAPTITTLEQVKSAYAGKGVEFFPKVDVAVGNELFWYCFDGDPVPENGYIDLDENTPGLGLTVNEDSLKNFEIIE